MTLADDAVCDVVAFVFVVVAVFAVVVVVVVAAAGEGFVEEGVAPVVVIVGREQVFDIFDLEFELLMPGEETGAADATDGETAADDEDDDDD